MPALGCQTDRALFVAQNAATFRRDYIAIAPSLVGLNTICPNRLDQIQQVSARLARILGADRHGEMGAVI